MQEKIKVITIGDYNISILKNYFKDNENIEFLKLALDESIDNLNTNFSKRDVVFLRTNTENLEKFTSNLKKNWNYKGLTPSEFKKEHSIESLEKLVILCEKAEKENKIIRCRKLTVKLTNNREER